MGFITTDFPGLLIFEPKIFEDERGYFFESYNQQSLLSASINLNFVQDNQAKSSYGVIRGLHFQLNPFAQTKLIRVLNGAILDVAVDLRKGSPMFGRSFVLELSAENKKQLFIPQGFAHGYSVISEFAEVFYKTDQYYNKLSEGGISYKDESLKIDWKIPIDKMIISEKDKAYKTLAEITINFEYQK